jgi:hypothetical protein
VITDPDSLHRTAKYFMDSGRAATAEDAVEMLARFGLTITIDAPAASTLNGQIALLTLVNTARRTMLGGVEIAGVGDEPVFDPAGDPGHAARSRRGARRHLRELGPDEWPRAIIGAGPPAGAAPAWRLQWSGWRGGVVPATWPASTARTRCRWRR